MADRSGFERMRRIISAIRTGNSQCPLLEFGERSFNVGSGRKAAFRAAYDLIAKPLIAITGGSFPSEAACKPYARTAAVRGDKFNARSFEREHNSLND